MAKRKPKTISKLVDEAATLLQLLVRIKAADDNGHVSCVTCGVTRHYKDGMQGGHFISRARLSTKLLEENIHPQCSRCNGPLKGNMIAYTLFMTDTYGREFVDELTYLSNTTKKYYKNEVEEIKKELNEQIRGREGRVCG